MTKALYGRVAMFRLKCPDCDSTALVVDGKFQCCGRALEIKEGDRLNLRRMCEGYRIRRKPGAIARRQILSFQNNQCVYCGTSLSNAKIEWDHFICFAFSWHSGEDNFVAACRECNQIKHDLLFKDIEEARDYLLYQRLKRNLPNFPYLGGEYEFEHPEVNAEIQQKADGGPAEALATRMRTYPRART